MLFNGSFALANRVRTSDGAGGWTESFGAAYATERGRMSAASGNERQTGPQLEDWISHIFFCRPGVAIQRGDQITGPDGRIYDVVAVRRPSPGRHIEADCREVQHGA